MFIKDQALPFMDLISKRRFVNMGSWSLAGDFAFEWAQPNYEPALLLGQTRYHQRVSDYPGGLLIKYSDLTGFYTWEGCY